MYTMRPLPPINATRVLAQEFPPRGPSKRIGVSVRRSRLRTVREHPAGIRESVVWQPDQLTTTVAAFGHNKREITMYTDRNFKTKKALKDTE